MVSYRKILAIAKSLAKNTNSWMELHNALFGIDGIITTQFQSEEERSDFCDSPEYREIEVLMADVREKKGDYAKSKKTDKILLRVNPLLHRIVKAKAKETGKSVNELLCDVIAKHFSVPFLAKK
jgi:predicted HicB family RNase H-like nuclease